MKTFKEFFEYIEEQINLQNFDDDNIIIIENKDAHYFLVNTWQFAEKEIVTLIKQKDFISYSENSDVFTVFIDPYFYFLKLYWSKVPENVIIRNESLIENGMVVGNDSPEITTEELVNHYNKIVLDYNSQNSFERYKKLVEAAKMRVALKPQYSDELFNKIMESFVEQANDMDIMSIHHVINTRQRSL